jgi:hypothetical protein
MGTAWRSVIKNRWVRIKPPFFLFFIFNHIVCYRFCFLRWHTLIKFRNCFFFKLWSVSLSHKISTINEIHISNIYNEDILSPSGGIIT